MFLNSNFVHLTTKEYNRGLIQISMPHFLDGFPKIFYLVLTDHSLITSQPNLGPEVSVFSVKILGVTRPRSDPRSPPPEMYVQPTELNVPGV